MGREAEDVLDVAPHVKRFQHLVAFVQDEMLYVLEVELFISGQSEDSTRSADHDVGVLRRKRMGEGRLVNAQCTKA